MRKLSCLFAGLLVCFGTSVSNADLVINITGVTGSGETTWTFTTTTDAVADANGTIRENADFGFNTNDTAQFGGGDGIFDALIQDQVFVLTGDASISATTIDRFDNEVTTTEDITGIFLDDDGAGAGDDLGIRVANELEYFLDDTITWTGSGVANVDISQLVEGTFTMNSGAFWNIDQGNTIVEIVAVAVPEPAAALGLFAVGLVGLTIRRKK